MIEKYRVILYSGESLPSLMEQMKKGILRRLNLPKESLEKLFGGQPIIVDQLISKAEAIKCKKALEAVGGACDIEPVSQFRQIDDLGFLERRLEWRRSDAERHSSGLSKERRKGRDRRRQS